MQALLKKAMKQALLKIKAIITVLGEPKLEPFYV